MKFEIVNKNEERTINGMDIPNGTVFVGQTLNSGGVVVCVKTYDGSDITVICSDSLSAGDRYFRTAEFTNYKPVKKLIVEV